MDSQLQDEIGFHLAEVWSKAATCSRSRVGAVIFDPRSRQISAGYNGSPAGMPHCDRDKACPRGRLDSVAPDSDYSTPGSPGFCIAIHAEMNALHNAVAPVRGGVMYVTRKPCPACTRELAGAGLRLVCWPGEQDHSYFRAEPRLLLDRMMNHDN